MAWRQAVFSFFSFVFFVACLNNNIISQPVFGSIELLLNSNSNSLVNNNIMPPLHDLYKELQGHNDFFDLLVDMIPAKVYVAGQSGTLWRRLSQVG